MLVDLAICQVMGRKTVYNDWLIVYNDWLIVYNDWLIVYNDWLIEITLLKVA